MTSQQPSTIRSSGAPRMTDGGNEVMAFHLHRFLAGWLDLHRLERLWVTLGFEHTACESTTFEVSHHESAQCRTGWTFEDLCQTSRRGSGRLYLEEAGQPGGPVILDVLPLLDRPAQGGPARVVMGFALLPQLESFDAEAIASLQLHLCEAIAAARRNAMRLFFDEHKASDLKSMLYAFMAHLPEWTGCDYAASTILTSTLETMTLEDASSPRFSVLSERLFFEPDERHDERLVGMSISLEEGTHSVLAAAFRQQRQDVELPYQIFVRDPDDLSRWAAQDGSARACAPFHAVASREDEAMYVLVPLVARDGEDVELLGFVCLTYRARAELSSGIGQLLAELGDHLGPLLRFSSLYALSARKLWILRRLRRAAERAIADAPHTPDALDRLIGEASALIAGHVEVPSFAIGAITRGPDNSRQLRYVHPHGWTSCSKLDLPVDVPESHRLDSGVSSLAVRLNRPLVLAGGHGAGDGLRFKNALCVHEATGRVIDARSVPRDQLPESQGWARLSRYYKSIRPYTYATLAYPITFCDEPIGVVSIEVEKSTNWLWWTGFGGHLFWQLVASELATAFYALGVRP